MIQRITAAEIIENEWFKKGYKPPRFEQADVSLDDVDAIFNESGVRFLIALRIFIISSTLLVPEFALKKVSMVTGIWKPCRGEARRRACGACHYECL